MVRIYKRTNSEKEKPDGNWDFWGMLKTPNIEKAIWRKEVTKEEAEQYELENELLD